MRAFPVSADDFGGNDSDVTDTACGTFRAFTYQCNAEGKKKDGYTESTIYIGSVPVTIRIGDSSNNEGAGGGGSAWHLYDLDITSRDENKYHHPNCTGTTAMTCNVTFETIKSTCNNDYYPWYMSYGWEGPRLQGNSHSTEHDYAWNEPKQYGPVALNSSGISYARYNNTNAVKASAISKRNTASLSGKKLKALLESNGGELHLSFAAAERIRETILDLGAYAEGTGYYCVPNFSVVFKARSEIEWGDYTDNEKRNTGDYVTVNKSAEPDPGVVDVTLGEGEELTIKFKQKVQVNAKVRANIKLTKSFKNESTGAEVGASGSGVTILNSGNIDLDTIQKEFVRPYKAYYVATDESSDSPYLVNLNKYKLRFDTAGTYYLCESLTVPVGSVYQYEEQDDVDPATPTTKACMRVKVVPTIPGLGAKTDITVDGASKSTGWTSVYKEISMPAISREVGQYAEILFTHHVGKSNTAKLTWAITDSPMYGSGYSIQRLLNGSYTEPSSMVSQRVRLDCTHGNLNINCDAISDYYYQIRFNAPGQYVFCETLHIDGTSSRNKITKACVTVSVGSSSGAAGRSSVSGKGETRYTDYRTESTVRTQSVAETTLDLGSYAVGSELSFSFDHWGGISPSGRSFWSLKAGFEQGNASAVRLGGWVGQQRHPKIWVGDGRVDMDSSWITLGGKRYYSELPTGKLVSPYFSNVYTAKANAVGTYKFCQTLSVAGVMLTKACVQWDIEKPPRDCDADNDDVTNVTSKVKNETTRTDDSTLVYAKPEDTVTWSQCYYAGVQNLANEIVTDVHVEYTGGSHNLWPSVDPSTNVNKEFYLVSTPWENKYKSTFPPGSTLVESSGSWNPGDVVTVKPTSSRIIETDDVGKTLSDSIISGTPTTASYHNHGKHTWNCMPSSSYSANNRGAVSKYDWVDRDPSNYTKVCDGTETCATYHCWNYTYYTIYDPNEGVCKPGENARESDAGQTRPDNIHVDTDDCTCSTGYRWITKDWLPVEWYRKTLCSHDNDYISKSSNQPSIASAASSVKVPYNFKLTADVKVSDDALYAGETMLVKGWANVETKYNDVTKGEYATKAEKVKTKLVAFVKAQDMSGNGGVESSTSDICAEVNGKQCAVLEESSNITLNDGANSDINGVDHQFIYGSHQSYKSYNAFDASAGDYVCFALAIYPATSGSDTNMNDYDGNGKWYISKYSCKIIAKKPMFQVYGAGLYSAGDITSNTATKYNLYPADGYAAYAKSGTSNARVFSPWVEQNLLLKGITSSVASGSSSAGGSTNLSFCRYRTPLSFANYSRTLGVGTICGPSIGNNVGQMGSTTGSTFGVMSDRSTYVNYWLPSDAAQNASAGITISLNSYYAETISRSGVRIRYVYGSGDLNISSSTIEKNVTFVVKTAGNIRIRGNIYYDGSGLTSMNSIPKLIIYGNNINIDCAVTEIDAILIANGTIDTCREGGVASAANRAQQLYIRGMTISNKLVLGRTYGAAAGKYSDYPAEIINYDSSAILWGRYMSSSAETGDLTMTYQHELAPRY